MLLKFDKGVEEKRIEEIKIAILLRLSFILMQINFKLISKLTAMTLEMRNQHRLGMNYTEAFLVRESFFFFFFLGIVAQLRHILLVY